MLIIKMSYLKQAFDLEKELNELFQLVQSVLQYDIAKICLDYDHLSHRLLRFKLWAKFAKITNETVQDKRENYRPSHLNYNFDKMETLEKHDKDDNNEYQQDFIDNVKKWYNAQMPRDVLEFLTTNIRTAFGTLKHYWISPIDIWSAGADFRNSGSALIFYNHPLQMPSYPMKMHFMTDVLHDVTRYVEDLHKVPPFTANMKWYAAWRNEWHEDHESLLFLGERIPDSNELEYVVGSEIIQQNLETCKIPASK
jgi:hypothetical protein